MKYSNWVLEPGKYLNKEEAARLLEVTKRRAEIALFKGKKLPFVITSSFILL